MPYYSYIAHYNTDFMNKKLHNHSVDELLNKEGVLSVPDFVSFWPDSPKASVYSRIRALLKSGRLSMVGKGQYQAIHKPEYPVVITDWMRDINKYLINKCDGINFCISQKGSNLYVDVSKKDINKVHTQLILRTSKVVFYKDAKLFPVDLEGFIILCVLVSDAPVLESEGICCPSLEKQLVDNICRKKMNLMEFQRAMEIYPVNINRLRRYASRRGVTEELSECLSYVNQERIRLFSATQKYLSTIPVERAWVFGSFARGEETQSSDLDLLVDYVKANTLSLLDTIKFKKGLENIIGREVDLVENGFLKSFALPSANKDKYLIYER